MALSRTILNLREVSSTAATDRDWSRTRPWPGNDAIVTEATHRHQHCSCHLPTGRFPGRGLPSVIHVLIGHLAPPSVITMERLSPLGADAKSLRRESKRSYSLTMSAGAHDEPTMASPTKRPQHDELMKPKPSKSGKAPGTASAKRKAVLQQEVAALQTVVDGIQRQVEEASKGIQELKQLVDLHLEARSQQHHTPMQPLQFQVPLSQPLHPSLTEQPLTCVSPPASLMAFDPPEPEGMAMDDFIEFPGMSSGSNPSHPPTYDSLMYYGGPPMSFSC